MSRVILNDHPWDASEVEYQLVRGRLADVEENKKDWPPGSEVVEPEDDSVVLELSQEIYEFVQSLDVPGLQAELKKNGLKQGGDEVALKVRLAQHLQAKEDAENADDA